jgi:abortive infection bacteriophage resistance protein
LEEKENQVLSDIAMSSRKQEFEFKKNRKPKLTTNQMIEKLREKGIIFEASSENEAFQILSELNYYYKLSVYRRNFKRNSQNKYTNLDFKHLSDCASMDMQLRYWFIQATLDIEHALKSHLLHDLSENADEDGYDIVLRFFQSINSSERIIDENAILSRFNNKKSYQNKLYLANNGVVPTWVFSEVAMFKDFLNFFEFYYKNYPSKDFNVHSIKGILDGVKRIRNMSAHNNTFLFDIAYGEIFHPSNLMKKYCNDLGISEIFYKTLKTHDSLSVMLLHQMFVKGEGSRKYRISDLDLLINRCSEKLNRFPEHTDLHYYFQTLNKTIDKKLLKR